MHTDIARILLPAERIRARVRKLAIEIATAYPDDGAGLTLVPIMSGSIIFLADLIRELPIRMKLALVHVSTYGGTRTVAGESKTILAPTGDLRDRHALIVDDILDSGRTLRHVQEIVRSSGPASVRTAVLLRKPAKAPPDVHVEFIGFDIDDLFVVGYGLDFDDHYRNYPHIGVLKSELMP